MSPTRFIHETAAATGTPIRHDAAVKKLVAVGLAIFIAPMCLQGADELSQLVVGVVGAAAYLAYQHYQQKLKVKSKNLKAKKVEGTLPASSALQKAVPPKPRRAGSGRQSSQKLSAPQPDVWQESKVPVVAPQFAADDFNAQAEELVARITPGEQTDLVAQKLAERAKAALEELFPGVDVMGFASGDVLRGTAFGVAVPELDIVASASPNALVECLSSRLSKGGIKMVQLDARKLQKAAIRACTDQLVARGGFKFRRSCFRAEDPKVTLMANPPAGLTDKSIPLDFSVNCVTPLHNHALVTESGQIDMRAKSLILLVRRWSKDRGICHAAKGHLAPYAWTLLVIYFMQVGIKDCPLLPALKDFRAVRDLRSKRCKSADEAKGSWSPLTEGSDLATMPLGELFRAFVDFYARNVDWRVEAASSLAGKRAAPNLNLELHIVVHEDQSSEVAPSVEDPFDPTRNLGSSLTTIGVKRLREELERASQMLQEGASFSSLLEPWTPPQRGEDERSDGECA